MTDPRLRAPGALIATDGGLFEVVEPARHGFGLIALDCADERRAFLYPSQVERATLVRPAPAPPDALPAAA